MNTGGGWETESVVLVEVPCPECEKVEGMYDALKLKPDSEGRKWQSNSRQ